MSSFSMNSHKREVQEELKRRVENALTRCAGEMEKHAKRNCPVDTGRLRNSVSTEVTSDDDENTLHTLSSARSELKHSRSLNRRLLTIKTHISELFETS